MFGKAPLDTAEFATCKHERIMPYGDGEMGKCMDCGDASFPMFDPEMPEQLKQMLINMPAAARLRVFGHFCFHCGDEAPNGCNCMRDE